MADGPFAEQLPQGESPKTNLSKNEPSPAQPGDAQAQPPAATPLTPQQSPQSWANPYAAPPTPGTPQGTYPPPYPAAAHGTSPYPAAPQGAFPNQATPYGTPTNPAAAHGIPPNPAAPHGTPPNPAAPHGTPPPNPFAAPHPDGSQVPPPPIAPDGPGQVPYGYPGHPAAYAYPAPGQQPYGAPPGVPGYYGWPGGMPPVQNNGMGTAALVTGIFSAVGFCLWPVALILGILGIVFGTIGRRKAKRGEASNGGQALAGIICGSAGLVMAIGFIVLIAFSTASSN